MNQSNRRGNGIRGIRSAGQARAPVILKKVFQFPTSEYFAVELQVTSTPPHEGCAAPLGMTGLGVARSFGTAEAVPLQTEDHGAGGGLCCISVISSMGICGMKMTKPMAAMDQRSR